MRILNFSQRRVGDGCTFDARRPAITVLGFDYPDHELDGLLKGDAQPPVQTRLFARRLTKALQVGADLPIFCISAAPVSEFPINPRRRIASSPARTFETSEGIVGFRSVPYVNKGILKVLTRQVSSVAEILRRGLVQRGGFVIVYSVHVPFMASGLVLARLTGATSVAVWTDPPAVLAAHSRKSEVLVRRAEDHLARSLCRRFDKVIAVTRDLAEDLAPNVDGLVVEAISDPLPGPSPQYREGGKTIVTYTGGISKKYGIDTLVDAVVSLPHSLDVELRIFGSGDYSDELQSIAGTDARISYFGSVTHPEAVDAQVNSDYLINARDPNEDFTRYSFPSKTLEYLASGVPVLSTRLPGIPHEYWRTLIPIEDASSSAISEAIISAAALTAEAREKLGQAGRRLAAERTYRAVGSQMWKYLTSGDTKR